MKLAIDIVQSLLLPKLEKDASFDINQTNIAFWETFTTALLDFEKDAKPVYATIYSLGLKDAEKIISKLDTVYISFIKELAENHVLGVRSEAIDYLITSKNSTFEKEVHFFTDLQNAITKAERKRIKTELPKTFDKLSYEISDNAIAIAITKKEREALKEKMNVWNKELDNIKSKKYKSNFLKIFLIVLIITLTALLIYELIIFNQKDINQKPNENKEIQVLNDSLRVKNNNGKFGYLSFTLIWNSIDDIDLIVLDTSKDTIFFGKNCKSNDNKFSLSGGQLDIDKNAGIDINTQPVENIYFKKKPPIGDYYVKILMYNKRDKEPVKYKLTVRKTGLIENEILGIISNQDEIQEVIKYRNEK